MNASEIRNIEERLTGSFTLPVSQEYLDTIVRRAKQQRAAYLVKLIASLPRAIARIGEGIRETAASCTAARIRMRHS